MDMFLLALERHFLIVVAAVGLAICVAVPLAVWARRHVFASALILGFGNLISTIPSIALYGLMIQLEIGRASCRERV